MNHQLKLLTSIRKVFLFGSLLNPFAADPLLQQSNAQTSWESIGNKEAKSSPIIWKSVTESEENHTSQTKWDPLREDKQQNQPPKTVLWEILDNNDELTIPTPGKTSNKEISSPTNLKEAEALFGNIPLSPSDYHPQLRLSPLVPTAETLPSEQWRFSFGYISPLQKAE